MAQRFVYITTDGAEEARRIGAALIEARLAACVNLIDGMTSLYRWQGKVEEGHETVLIAKTRAALVPALVETVKRLHSYECPCVVALPIEQGNADFLAWIDDETREPDED